MSVFSFFNKKPFDKAAKPGVPPPLPGANGTPALPAGNDLEDAIKAVKSGPWNPQKIIRGLVMSEAYLLLETSSDPESYLVMVADDTPHIAFFSSIAHFPAAQQVHPGFIHPWKVSPWQVIKTLNDGVGFIINPYSPDSEYYAGAVHTAAIRDLFLGGPSPSAVQNV